MAITLGEYVQSALTQKKLGGGGWRGGKSQSTSLLTLIIQLPRTVLQEHTINAVNNTKLLHQIFS